ncbi:hypothetical protein AWC11_23245 [Mycobacterium interjectum]|nr:hypothetical protein AWC11_23245 [Mycobacterium interjectum]
MRCQFGQFAHLPSGRVALPKAQPRWLLTSATRARGEKAWGEGLVEAHQRAGAVLTLGRLAAIDLNPLLKNDFRGEVHSAMSTQNDGCTTIDLAPTEALSVFRLIENS